MKKRSAKKATPFTIAVAAIIWILAGCSGGPAPAQGADQAAPSIAASAVAQADIPVQVKQPMTANDVCRDLHGTDFVSKSLGNARVMWGMTSGGTCMVKGHKYGINVFNSHHLMARWLRTAKQYGVNPKWETHASVTYPSLLG